MRGPARALALLGLGVAAALAAPAAWAHTEEGLKAVLSEQRAKSVVEEVGFDQRLGEAVPLDATLRDEAGRPLTLRAAMAGKPTLLVLLYYKCTMLCPLMLDGLVRSLRPLSFDVGKEFSIVTLSINPQETPGLAAAKKELYLQRYGRPGAERGWHFLTGDPPAIRALAAAVGFRYRYERERDEFAHPAGLVLLTPEGRIARYFYGVDFAVRDLRLGLVEAAANRIGSPVDQLLLLCYHYDPMTGKYGLVVMNVLRLAGFATVLALGGFILVALRRDRRPRPAAAGD